MKIESQPLITALNSVARLATKRTTLPILNHLRLSASGGVLEISSTNLDAYQIAKAECDGDLAPICIPATHFQRLTANGNGHVSLELANNRVTIKSGWTAELPTLAAEEFPAFPDKDMKAIGVNCDDLADGIEGVEWAAHDDSFAEGILSCVSVELSEKLIRLFATNRRKCAIFERASIAGKYSCLLPQSGAKALAEALRQKGAQLSAGEKHISVTHDAGSFCVRLGEGKYPNFEPQLKAEQKRIGSVARLQLIGHLEQCGYLTDGEVSPGGVKLSFEPRTLRIYADNKHGGKYESRMDGKFTEKDFELNGNLFAEMLGHCATDLLILGAIAEANAIRWQDGDLTYLLATYASKK